MRGLGSFQCWNWWSVDQLRVVDGFLLEIREAAVDLIFDQLRVDDRFLLGIRTVAIDDFISDKLGVDYGYFRDSSSGTLSVSRHEQAPSSHG